MCAGPRAVGLPAAPLAAAPTRPGTAPAPQWAPGQEYKRRCQQREPQDPTDIALRDVLGVADLVNRGVHAVIEHPLPPPRTRALTSVPSGCGFEVDTISRPLGATMRLRPPRRWKRMGIRTTSVVPFMPPSSQPAASAHRSGWRLPRPPIYTSSASSRTSTRSTGSCTTPPAPPGTAARWRAGEAERPEEVTAPPRGGDS